jgi:hypothetical protein
MPYKETMSLHDKLVVDGKALELENQGKHDEAKRLVKRTPLEPYLAKFIKDHLGLDALLKSGWNLADAEAAFGAGWLSR